MTRKDEVETTPERSKLMARVRQSSTSVELAVRKFVQECGCEFETNVTELPGSPDLVNSREMWVIFAHGCFWHSHKGCKRATVPKRNRDFWLKKFIANRDRDLEKVQRLKELGYSILVVWECELKKEEKIRKKIHEFLTHQKTDCANEPTTTNDQENYALPRMEFRHSPLEKIIKRVVHLPDGRQITTQVQFNNGDLNGKDLDSVFDYALLRKRIAPQHTPSSKVIRTVDLFCGCGGLSLGAMEACRALGKRFVAVAAVDKDPVFLEVYKKNFPESKTNKACVETLVDGDIGSAPTENERCLLEKLKNVNLLLAGPPCQGHSSLNNRKKKDDSRNALYKRVARLVEIANPQHVFIENVPAIISSKNMEVQKSIELMCELKYNVDAGIVNLAAIGVPQSRRRHIIVASTLKRLEIKNVIKKYRVGHRRSVRWAIEDIENETPNGQFTKPSQLSETNVMRIKYLHRDDLYDLPNHLRPPCHRNGHTYPAVYGRIRYDEPSPTITCGFLCPGQGRYIHSTQLRTLTPHEAARLQFFPDYFDFSSVKTRYSLSRAIGNAVPMKLSYVFCLELLA